MQSEPSLHTSDGDVPRKKQEDSPKGGGSDTTGVSATSPDGGGASGKRRRKTAKDSVDSDGAIVKAHHCDWPDCNKSFSRIDHLRRHYLNHTPSQIFTCNRCGKGFVRADLLLRHVERHERRELMTKPGTTRPLTIVEAARQFARPVDEPRNPPASSGSHAITSGSAGTVSASSIPPAMTSASVSPSTMVDAHSPFAYPAPQQISHSLAGAENRVPAAVEALATNMQHRVNPDVFDASMSSASHPSEPRVAYTFNGSYSTPFTSSHLPLFDLGGENGSGPNNHSHNLHSSSNSSTANPALDLGDPLNFLQSSYGVPFVSRSEYDWLFNADGGFEVTLTSSRPASPGPEDDRGDHDNTLPAHGLHSGVHIHDLSFGHDLQALHQSSANHSFNDHVQARRNVNDALQALDHQTQSAPHNGSPTKTESDSTPRQPMDISPVPVPTVATPAALSTTTAPSASVSNLRADHPMDQDEVDPNRRRARSDPSSFVSVQTHNRLLEYLGPEWERLLHDSRFAAANLQEYLRLYWERVHAPQMPVIHRASFRTEHAPPPLLLAMIMLGCYFSSPDASQLSVLLHPHLRGRVICSGGFRPKAPLWLHQTALLTIVFGKLCSNRLGHEMSHIHWSSVVTLSRRSGLFTQRASRVPEQAKGDIGLQWAAWIEDESYKRLAHAQFAVVRCRTLAVILYTSRSHSWLTIGRILFSLIQLTLPCDDDEWEASTAEEWAQINAQSRQAIPFISALKASLVNGAAPPVLNPFARISILHGLLSVAQDLQWRDHVVGLSQPERTHHNWRDMISSAYNSWKSRLDTYLMTSVWPTNQLLRASISLYATAHITLSIDIHELEIFAGAQTALGLVVSQPVYEATTVRVRSWASTKDGRTATWHGAHFLRSSLQHWCDTGDDLAGCLHHRWAVHMGTLTLYCFGTCTDGPAGPRRPDVRDAAMRYLDKMCTSSPEALINVPNKNDVVALCELVCEYIGASTWEIAQEGAKILAKIAAKASH